MDTITGIWSARLPATFNDNTGLRATGWVRAAYYTDQPDQLTIFQREAPGIPEHIWTFNLLEVNDNVGIFRLRGKNGLIVRISVKAIMAFLENAEDELRDGCKASEHWFRIQSWLCGAD